MQIGEAFGLLQARLPENVPLSLSSNCQTAQLLPLTLLCLPSLSSLLDDFLQDSGLPTHGYAHVTWSAVQPASALVGLRTGKLALVLVPQWTTPRWQIHTHWCIPVHMSPKWHMMQLSEKRRWQQKPSGGLREAQHQLEVAKNKTKAKHAARLGSLLCT